MKTRVRVRRVAECEVEFESEHAEDEDPCDLLPGEVECVLAMADGEWPRWEIDRVTEVSS